MQQTGFPEAIHLPVYHHSVKKGIITLCNQVKLSFSGFESTALMTLVTLTIEYSIFLIEFLLCWRQEHLLRIGPALNISYRLHDELRNAVGFLQPEKMKVSFVPRLCRNYSLFTPRIISAVICHIPIRQYPITVLIY